MSDLVTWLRGCLDEDQKVAEAATPGPWRWENEEFSDGGECPHYTEWCDHGPDLVGPSDDDCVLSATGYDASSLQVTRADATHIALHDPARVLRQVQAYREILTWYVDSAPPYADSRQQERHEELEPVLEALASVFSDRPGYSEAVA